MKNTLWSGVALALCALPSSATQQTASAKEFVREGGQWYLVDGPQRFRVDPSVVSVRFNESVENLDGFRSALARRSALTGALAGLSSVRSNRLGIHDLEIPAGADVFEVLARLRATGLVEFAEENTFGTYGGGPSDPLYGNQWHFDNTGQSGGTPGADVSAEEAWAVESGDPAVIVAVLDSGTQISHPDLSQNNWENPGEVPSNGTDDDSNGYVDDVFGWDFGNNNNNVEGPFFHGTFVAGIVGARTDNGTGVAGMAGGMGASNGCTMMPLGVGDSSPNGSVLDDAIIYAADNGARVITMSLTVGQTTAINDALDYARNTKGVFIDCAAGNGGVVAYPSSNTNVIAVGSTTRFDTLAGGSGTGPLLYIVAPGQDVYSTSTSSGYTTSSGTSFAAPHVAGLAGLMISINPALTPTEVADIMKDTAKDLGSAGFDNIYGWGRINAHDAVVLAGELACCGTSYCTGATNSTGKSGKMAVTGSDVVTDDDLVLTATRLPTENNIGYFIMGDGMNTFVPPGSAGRICIGGGGQFLRYLPPPSNTNELPGGFSRSVGTSGPISGAITPGSTWNFQAWHRDQAAGTSNLTDAVSVIFQ